MEKQINPALSNTDTVLFKEPGKDWRQVLVSVRPERGIRHSTLEQMVGEHSEPFHRPYHTVFANEQDEAPPGMQPCIRLKLIGGAVIVLVGPVAVVATHFDPSGFRTYRGIKREEVARVINGD